MYLQVSKIVHIPPLGTLSDVATDTGIYRDFKNNVLKKVNIQKQLIPFIWTYV